MSMTCRACSSTGTSERISRYRRCSLNDATAVSTCSADVHLVRRIRHVLHGDVLHARPPRLGQVGEDPLVAGVGHGVQHALAERPVVGGVHVARRHPGRRPGGAVVPGDDELRLVPPDGRGDVAPQLGTGDQGAVPVVEELHLGHADDGGRPPLLLLAQRPGLLRRHAGHPGLAAGGQQVVHLLAGGRPRGDGGRDAVLDVVGMRRDDEGALPVVGHGLGRHARQSAAGRLSALRVRAPRPRPGCAESVGAAARTSHSTSSAADDARHAAGEEHVPQPVGVAAASSVGQPARAPRVGRRQDPLRLTGRQRRREAGRVGGARRPAAPPSRRW